MQKAVVTWHLQSSPALNMSGGSGILRKQGESYSGRQKQAVLMHAFGRQQKALAAPVHAAGTGMQPQG